MTDFTVGICGILYLVTAIGFIIKQEFSWALTYFAYALANVGLILASKGH